MSTTLRASIEIVPVVSVKTTSADNVRPDTYKPPTSLLPAMKEVYSDGTGSNQANKHYHNALTITAAGSTTIDLTAAVDANGTSWTFSKVKWMIIRLRTPATAKYITVGNAATNIFSAFLSASTTTFQVDGLYCRDNPIDGWTVDATHKNLKIANPYASSVIVDVSIGGY